MMDSTMKSDRFIYLIYNYRLLYYLPMERMKHLEEMLRELSEKYKNSKSVEVYEEDLEWWFKIIDDLREENKKLNIKVASLEWEIKWLNSVIEKLKEENQTLELWLDNKEKLNEGYRKELKSTYVYDAKQVRDIC